MKATYANVTSTIALFAALTTGTGYAANVIARDSVRSAHVKNGQITMADLHPTVRANLRRATTGGGSTPSPDAGGLLPHGQWADTGALVSSLWTASPRTDGRRTLTRIGTTGNVEFRLVGSITKDATGGADVTLSTYTSSGASKHGHGWFGPTGIGTFDQTTFSGGTLTVPAADAQQVEATYTAVDGATSTMRVQVRRVT